MEDLHINYQGRGFFCNGSPSLRTADAFPVVASLFSVGEKRRPEMRLLLAGYGSPRPP